MLFLIIGMIHRYLIQVKKAGFAGIALFRDFDLNTHEGSFVRNHLNEACVRNRDEVLIVVPPVIHPLLPQRVLPDNDRSYPLFNQKVHNALTGRVQVVIHLPVALIGDLFHLARDPLSIFFGQLLLELFHALIVPLVVRLQRTTVNQAGDKALTV